MFTFLVVGLIGCVVGYAVGRLTAKTNSVVVAASEVKDAVVADAKSVVSKL